MNGLRKGLPEDKALALAVGGPVPLGLTLGPCHVLSLPPGPYQPLLGHFVVSDRHLFPRRKTIEAEGI